MQEYTIVHAHCVCVYEFGNLQSRLQLPPSAQFLCDTNMNMPNHIYPLIFNSVNIFQ